MIYELTDLIQEKLIAAGFNNVSYGIEGSFDLDKQNLLPLAHIGLNTSEQSNFNQISFYVTIMDVLASTDLMETSEMDNKFKHVQNLIDIQHDLNIRGHRFINSLVIADTTFQQRLSNTPSLQWNDDLAKDHLVGYDFELVFNVKLICS
jgi:hypothetical protein